MNIDDMPAGRELDALVAEKVMGWCITAWNDGEPWGNREVFPPFEPINGIPADCDCISHSEAGEPPHYSTDIAAAWEVVEKLDGGGERGTFWWMISSPGNDTMYSARIFEGSVEIVGAMAPTAPLAICRAALRTVV